MMIYVVKYHWLVRGHVPNFLAGFTYSSTLTDLHVSATIAGTAIVTNYPSSYSGLRTGLYFCISVFQVLLA